jgi:hypothetical protein
MTNEVIAKLRQAYLIGATNSEACGYAEIGERTLYDYLEKNPEFSQTIENWKNEPILSARKKVTDNIKNDVRVAQWYLERKRKSEFAQRQELTGDEGAAINVIIEDTYAKQPKFRTDNNNAEANDLAEGSSE